MGHCHLSFMCQLENFCCLIVRFWQCEVAGFPTVPVAEGSLVTLKGTLPRIADFVHGADGLGNTFQAKPKGFKSESNASDFLIQKVAEFPNEVTVVALGPLTNIAEVRPPVANLGHTVFC
jgi:inosine-uridine nucleoside N-ribohydrolase